MAFLSSLLFVKMPKTLVCLHEGLLRVPTPFIWSLQPYGAAVPSSLIQCNSFFVFHQFIEYMQHKNTILTKKELF